MKAGPKPCLLVLCSRNSRAVASAPTMFYPLHTAECVDAPRPGARDRAIALRADRIAAAMSAANPGDTARGSRCGNSWPLSGARGRGARCSSHTDLLYAGQCGGGGGGGGGGGHRGRLRWYSMRPRDDEGDLCAILENASRRLRQLLAVRCICPRTSASATSRSGSCRAMLSVGEVQSQSSALERT